MDDVTLLLTIVSILLSTLLGLLCAQLHSMNEKISDIRMEIKEKFFDIKMDITTIKMLNQNTNERKARK